MHVAMVNYRTMIFTRSFTNWLQSYLEWKEQIGVIILNFPFIFCVCVCKKQGYKTSPSHAVCCKSEVTGFCLTTLFYLLKNNSELWTYKSHYRSSMGIQDQGVLIQLSPVRKQNSHKKTTQPNRPQNHLQRRNRKKMKKGFKWMKHTMQNRKVVQSVR